MFFHLQASKASAEATDHLQSMKMAKERLERDLERLQHKEDSSDSLRRRLRETEVHAHVFSHLLSATCHRSEYRVISCFVTL